MFWFFKIRKHVKNHFLFDKWVNDVLVHYNFYENQIELKDRDLKLLYYVDIKPFMKVKKEWKRVVKIAFSD